MSTLLIEGIGSVRTGIVLAAISAQEDLEYDASKREQAKLAGPSAMARVERAIYAAARRRNAQEKLLRSTEHKLWSAFRDADTASREAIRAVLLDPPTGHIVTLPKLTRKA